jgi:hypothetical protein
MLPPCMAWSEFPKVEACAPAAPPPSCLQRLNEEQKQWGFVKPPRGSAAQHANKTQKLKERPCTFFLSIVAVMLLRTGACQQGQVHAASQMNARYGCDDEEGKAFSR